MAIDTAEKRKAISGVTIGLIPGVTPNSGADQEWRQQSGWSYSGILADAPPAPTTVKRVKRGAWILAHRALGLR